MTLYDAVSLANLAHKDQKDKCGLPYILHPMRVCTSVIEHGETAAVLGVLHDTLEDGVNLGETVEARLDYLMTNGLTSYEATLLIALTHMETEPYMSYIDRVMDYPLSRIIKIADIRDNLNPSRLSKLIQSEQDRLKAKYKRALEAILD